MPHVQQEIRGALVFEVLVVRVSLWKFHVPRDCMDLARALQKQRCSSLFPPALLLRNRVCVRCDGDEQHRERAGFSNLHLIGWLDIVLAQCAIRAGCWPCSGHQKGASSCCWSMVLAQTYVATSRDANRCPSLFSICIDCFFAIV